MAIRWLENSAEAGFRCLKRSVKGCTNSKRSCLEIGLVSPQPIQRVLIINQSSDIFSS